PWDEVFALGVTAAQALGDRADEAKLLNFLGWAQVFCLGATETGYATHQKALGVAVSTDDRLEQAWAHAYMAAALLRLGHSGQALVNARQAYELAPEFSFWTVQLSLRNRLGRVLQALGRYEEALSVHEDALADCTTYRAETSA